MSIWSRRKTDKSMKRRVIVWTITSLAVLVTLLVEVTLTPLAQRGNGTRFLSTGMWYNLIWVGSMYVIPVSLYILGIKSMRYVLAGVVGFWIIPVPVIGIIGARSLVLVPGERRNILCESAHYEYSVTVCTGSKYRMVYCLFWKAGKVTLDIHTIGMYNKHTVSM